MIEPAPLQQVARTYVHFQGRRLSYFSGCDYFRLASHPGVLGAMRAGLERFGANVAASRLTTGNHALYRQLEGALARFFGVADALLVPSGYVTNLAVAQALARGFSHALLDEVAHPSLRDAALFLDCPVIRFRHRDAAAVARTVRRCGRGAKFILLTDGMFANDGSVAPLRAYRQALPRDALLLVDDAHGAGTLGDTGKGTVEVQGVGRRGLVQTITLSKAFGAFGGAVLGTSALRRKILARSHLFAGSTPLPLPLAAAALEAVRVLSTDKGLRRRLTRNAAYVKGALRAADFRLPETPGPIISVTPAGDADTGFLRRALLAAGIYPPLVHYPGGPAGGYFRFVISSEHSREQLDCLLKVLLAFREAQGS